MVFRITFLIILKLAIATHLLCQSTQSIDILQARQNSVAHLNKKLNIKTVITGKQYNPVKVNEIESRYFRSDDLSLGTILYEGVLVKNVLIQYDLFDQQIVVQLASGPKDKYISVDQHKVSSFSFNGYQFVNVPLNDAMEKGFYQIAFEGKSSSLLIKRIKNQVKQIEASKIKIRFTLRNQFYIENEHGIFHIKSKEDLLAAFNYSDILKRIIKEKKIKFSSRHIEVGIRSAISAFDNENHNQQK